MVSALRWLLAAAARHCGETSAIRLRISLQANGPTSRRSGTLSTVTPFARSQIGVRKRFCQSGLGTRFINTNARNALVRKEAAVHARRALFMPCEAESRCSNRSQAMCTFILRRSHRRLEAPGPDVTRNTPASG